MALVYQQMRRLDARGPASRGVVVDADGAMLGPDCVLVNRAPPLAASSIIYTSPDQP